MNIIIYEAVTVPLNALHTPRCLLVAKLALHFQAPLHAFCICQNVQYMYFGIPTTEALLVES